MRKYLLLLVLTSLFFVLFSYASKASEVVPSEAFADEFSNTIDDPNMSISSDYYQDNESDEFYSDNTGIERAPAILGPPTDEPIGENAHLYR